MIRTYSIVIPVYNCEDTVCDSVMCALEQLSSSDEVIVVDDCSTDDSLKKISALADLDGRVKIVCLPENGGRFAARKAGVEKSSCDYILFLDADDLYSNDAIEVIDSCMNEGPYDIVHFGIDVLDASKPDHPHMDNSFFEPYDGLLRGKTIFDRCFIDRKYGWNLANKCFESSICKKAFELLSDNYAQRGEDALIYFAISYLASTYRGLKGKNLYVYNFGAGQDTYNPISLESFVGFCESASAVSSIESFVKSFDGTERLNTAFEIIRVLLIDNCTRKLKSQVRECDFDAGVDALVRHWGLPRALGSLARVYKGSEGVFAKTISFPSPAKLEKGDTIATYYWKISGGGVENVQKTLISVWQSLGLNVIVMTDNEPEAEVLDKLGVECVVLPAFTEKNYEKRGQLILETFSKYRVRCLVTHQWLSESMMWDIAAAKYSSASVIIHCHGIFADKSMWLSGYFTQMPYVYSHADAIVSLGKTDAHFWGNFNKRTFSTMNLPSVYPNSIKQRSLGAEKKVLWLGRVDPEKKPDHALRIFSKIHQQDNTVRFVLAGASFDPSYQSKIHCLVKSLGLDGYVELTGWTDEQDKYYSEATLFLMTSDPKEGYPLTLAESRAYGLPCVMYSLPYLTFAQEDCGIVSVKQNDVDAAANEILALLSDSDRYQCLSRDACDFAEKNISFDFASLWESILFAQASREGMDVAVHNFCTQDRIVWETYFAAYDIAISRASYRALEDEAKSLRSENARIRKQLTQAKNKNERYRKSNSWKIGRAITFIPRRIKLALRGK